MSSYYASTLNGFGASRISVGGQARSSATGGANVLTFESQARSVTLRDGALLRAPQVFVSAGGITLEAGAAIDTIGAGRAYYDSAEGYLYSPGRSAVLALSNGLITMLAPDAPQGPESNPPGAIEIGACAGLCARPARLYTEGTLAAATDGRFILGEQARYGARQLALSVSAVNAGSAQALAAAAARGAAGGHDLEPGAAGSAAHGRRGFRRAGAGSTDADGQGLGQLLRNGGPERLGVACGQALGPAN